MLLEKYTYDYDDDFARFTFESNGPKGVIKKVVKYTKVGSWDDFSIYNLGFGDWSDELNDLDDSKISNNDDRGKILATVASTTLKFSERHGQLIVVAKGVTPSRTRLYQMALNANLAEVEMYFWLYGIDQGIPLPFKAGVNYQSFWVVKK